MIKVGVPGFLGERAVVTPDALYYEGYDLSKESPKEDGWYWCVWKDQDDTLDMDTPIPMEWYESKWWDNSCCGPFVGISPDVCFGPIPKPIPYLKLMRFDY